MPVSTKSTLIVAKSIFTLPPYLYIPYINQFFHKLPRVIHTDNPALPIIIFYIFLYPHIFVS